MARTVPGFTYENFESCADKLEIIDMKDCLKKSSMFGNYMYLIDEEMITALREGKVLYNLDEYGTFIALRRPKEDN